MLNLEPRPDICATLLHDFLEVAGNEMFKAYGAQFKKLLAYICQIYFPKLEKVRSRIRESYSFFISLRTKYLILLKLPRH